MNLFAGWEVIFQEFSLGIRGNECNSDFSPTILLKMPAIAEHSQRLVSRPAVTRQSAKKRAAGPSGLPPHVAKLNASARAAWKLEWRGLRRPCRRCPCR